MLYLAERFGKKIVSNAMFRYAGYRLLMLGRYYMLKGMDGLFFEHTMGIP
jgi:hypothetical protein